MSNHLEARVVTKGFHGLFSLIPAETASHFQTEVRQKKFLRRVRNVKEKMGSGVPCGHHDI